MKKIFAFSLSLVLIFSLITPPVMAQDLDSSESEATELAEHVPGEILISFNPGVRSAQAVQKMNEQGLEHVKEIKPLGVHLVKLPPGLSIEKALERFSHLPGVEFAEPNYIYQLAATPPTEIADQWGLLKVKGDQAWGVVPQNPILLATVDTGIDRFHDDLSANIWENSLEVQGNASEDDDLNGFVDDTWGWDFFNNDNDPFDDNMHGTGVSSVMAGVKDNGGVAGVCPWCQVMAVKVLGADGSGSLDVVAQGINYAAQNEARVINLSLRGPHGDTMEAAVNNAWDAGAVVVAAAGNDGLNSIFYPSGYANAMGIASTDENDNHSCFSNYAENSISVSAPGERIWMAEPNQSYGKWSGTSLSAPHVAGLAGLLFSQFYLDETYTNADVRAQIEATADDLGPPGVDAFFGHGRINAYRALGYGPPSAVPEDGTFSTSNTATGYAHARKLVRDDSDTLHMIWHTKVGADFQIKYAYSGDEGQNWVMDPGTSLVYGSTNETYHPALAVDADYLYVAIPSRIGQDLPYQILFTRKPLSGSEWSDPVSIMGGNYHTVRPDIFVDPTNGRLHVIASSLDNAIDGTSDLYYRASNSQGATWDDLRQFNPSNSSAKTRYATIHAHGDNLYVATRTVSNIIIFTYYYLHTVRSTDGGLTWIDQTQISSYLALTTGEYGVSLAGVGDRLYMGYEVGSNLYFRRYDGAGWSPYLQLETGDPTIENPIVYKWPSITQADDGQAWMLFQMRGDLYMRHYDGSNWEPKENLSSGSYANLKLGTGGGQVEWVYTNCSGSPFDLIYDSLGLGPNSPPQAVDDTGTVAEGGTLNELSPGVLGNDSDPENDSMTVTTTPVTSPTYGALTLYANGSYTYTHNGSETNSDSFAYEVCDTGSLCDTATVNLTITPVNDPPLAVDDIGTVAEGGTLNEPAVTGLLSNDSDPENDSMTVNTTPVTSPTNGALTLYINGAYTYTHNGSETISDSFEYEICDSGSPSLCDTAAVNLTITPVNDPPVSDFSATPVSGTAPLTVTFSDSSTGTITSWSWDFGDGGSSILQNPSYDYTTPGIYTVSLTVSGPEGSATETKLDYITVTSSSLHVGDLNSLVTNQPRNRWGATVTITVHDSIHNPVPNATVNGSWSNGATGSPSCITDSNGICNVTKNNLKGNVSSITFTVDTITHVALAYNSSANHDSGGESSDGTTITIYKDGPPGNQPPVASFTYNCIDLSCDFASTSFDPDGNISSYTWDFGDNQTGSGVTVSHTYAGQGPYSVMLTVTDSEGASSSDSQQVFLGDILYMHVGDLDSRAESGKRNRWNASVDILVHSVSEGPVPSVTVSGSWSSGAVGSCITEFDGWCTITLTNIKSTVSSVNFSVTELAAVGWVYDLLSNHDPDGDSIAGTSITISQ